MPTPKNCTEIYVFRQWSSKSYLPIREPQNLLTLLQLSTRRQPPALHQVLAVVLVTEDPLLGISLIRGRRNGLEWLAQPYSIQSLAFWWEWEVRRRRGKEGKTCLYHQHSNSWQLYDRVSAGRCESNPVVETQHLHQSTSTTPGGNAWGKGLVRRKKKH